MNAFHKFLDEMAHKNTAVVPNGLTDELTESVKRTEARAGCYGPENPEPTADDGIEQFGRCGESARSEQKKAASGSSELVRNTPPLLITEQRPIHLSGRGVDVLILARSYQLTLRSLCWVPAWSATHEDLRRHLDEIMGYVLNNGLLNEFAEAELSLLSATGEAASV